ncbi:MAG: hypothetical protein D6689_01260 [Deltaproteobacteria bacterium]|nr:MAG: hypothetical protein D6689_01260 [Deltaproteobacteria bacterium]
MRVDQLIASLAGVCASLAGCGSSGLGDACDSVLDCPPGATCRDGVCVGVDLPDAAALPPTDAGVDATSAAVDAAPADAGPTVDGDLGLQTDAGFTGTGCTLPPVIGPINPVEELRFPDPPCEGPCGNPGCAGIPGDPLPNHFQVVATPTVANLTDDDGDGDVDLDDVPDIVFMTYNDRNITNQGVIRILSGRPDAAGKPVLHKLIPIQDPADPCYDPADAALRHDSSTSVAIGDLDGDGAAELVALLSTGPAVAWSRDGCRLWTATQPVGANDGNAGAPTIADLDGDGKGEVVIGRVVLNHDGSVRWIGTGDRGANVFSVHSVVANLDLVGASEVIAGSTVYAADGTIACRNTAVGDGLNAVGNFDADPEGEFVVVRSGKVYLLDTDCTELWRFDVGSATTTVDNGLGAGPGGACAGSGGGEPTIADFDGDGLPEIALANSNCYTVINGDGTLLWASRSEDDSSQGTGSSVFDFNGDGVSEVIYNDEHYLRIYNGPDGKVLFMQGNSSRTRHENPIVVDVDNDGNAELVYIENNEAGFACAPGQTGGAGIHVLGDDPAVDAWVPTRRIWNQHSYHITNIEEDGTLPRPERANWLLPGYNNYRTNLPDFSVLSAPDLVVEIVDVVGTACGMSPPMAAVDYRVCNRGDVRVGPGIDVSLFVDGTLVAVDATSVTLEPGECETRTAVVEVPPAPATFDVTVIVDDDGSGAGKARECNEDNNTDERTDQSCDIIN